MIASELKTKLREAVSLRQSKEHRRTVETILEDLVQISSQKLPNAGIDGRWRLVWSSQTAEANPFAKPSSVLGGDCYQASHNEPDFHVLSARTHGIRANLVNFSAV